MFKKIQPPKQRVYSNFTNQQSPCFLSRSVRLSHLTCSTTAEMWNFLNVWHIFIKWKTFINSSVLLRNHRVFEIIINHVIPVMSILQSFPLVAACVWARILNDFIMSTCVCTWCNARLVDYRAYGLLSDKGLMQSIISKIYISEIFGKFSNREYITSSLETWNVFILYSVS